jgi:hypothetical protein
MDSDSLIQAALMLSRLACDSGHDVLYGVRIIDPQYRDGGPQVVPAERWNAWHISDDTARAWLSQPRPTPQASLLTPRGGP